MTGLTQGELVQAPVRATRRGHPCPPWCVIDHHASHGTNSRTGEPIYLSTHVSARGPDRDADAVAVQPGYDLGVQPDVEANASGTLCYVSADEANGLAGLLDAIANEEWKPAQVRQLAARVRAAAALIEAAR